MSSNSLTSANPAFEDAKISPLEEGEKRASQRRSIEVHVAAPGHASIGPVSFDDVVEVNDLSKPRKSLPDADDDKEMIEGINMWKLENVGLYCHYAMVGLLSGITSGITRVTCVYILNGSRNYCINIGNIVYIAWNLKIFYAILADMWWPFGLRRKPYMVFAWSAVLALLIVLSINFHNFTAESFGIMMMLIQAIFMIANVPADGYCVQLAEYEAPHKRGEILATGQAMRFSMGILVNFFQSFLLNGPATNSPNTPIAWDQGWTWGLSAPQYVLLIGVLIAVLFVPIIFMKEVKSEDLEMRTWVGHFSAMWDILQSKTSFGLIMYAFWFTGIAGLVPSTYGYTQYYILEIPNLLQGIESMMAYFLLTAAVLIFRTFLINKNWRWVNYGSETLATAYSFIWVLVYYDIGGLRNGWFTVFISITSTFIEGLTQVLASIAVIEISQEGMEATTYELLISVMNGCLTLSSIIATQITTAFGVNEVVTDSPEEFEATNGPYLYTVYTAAIMAISIVGMLIATRFLPVNREMCHQWKEEGEAAGLNKKYGYAALTIALTTVTYGLIVSFVYLNENLSCQKWVGGSGCE